MVFLSKNKQPLNNLLKIVVLSLSSLVLINCGGGGGGSDSVASNENPSTNARLDGLQLNTGNLDQLFQSSQPNYSAGVTFLTTSIQITAFTEDENASLTVNGVVTTSGEPSALIDLKEGGNSISIVATAEDGITTQAYDLSIHRQSLQAFAQRAYLKASNTGVDDRFGWSVALSGDTLAVGALNEDSNGTGINTGSQADDSLVDSGAVYVFTRNAGIWSQQAYIKASNTGADDRFGYSVALSGDTLAVGANDEGSNGAGINSGNQADDSATNSGAVYVYTRNAGIWSQQAYIKASNTDAGDQFGNSVALSGDTLAVGAHREDSNGTGINIGSQADNSASNSGAVYVFTRNVGIWSQHAYIKASNAGAADRFGENVALSGDTLAVGAYGEDSNGTGINSGSQADDNANSSGAVYVFIRRGGFWGQQAYIKASNTDAADQFGWSVALSGETLAVGANDEDSNSSGINSSSQADDSAPVSGAVYVFTRNAGIWSQQAYIKASNTDTFDRFGWSVALSGDTLAVWGNGEDSNGTGINSGSQADDSASNSGAVYVFTRNAGIWSQQAYIKASNTGAGDRFGNSVVLSGDTLAVGAYREDSNGTGINTGSQADDSAFISGAVYVFR